MKTGANQLLTFHLQAFHLWGDGDWGQNVTTVILTGVSATTALGPICPGWGQIAWGNSDYGWGYPVIPQQQMGLTGVSATTTLGTLTVTPETIASLTGVSATTADGSLNIINWSFCNNCSRGYYSYF